MGESCYIWEFQQTYDFADRGNFNVHIDMNRSVCNQAKQISFTDEDNLIWVSLLAIILSLISFITIWVYFYGMAEHLKKLQAAYNKRFNVVESKKEADEDVTVREQKQVSQDLCMSLQARLQ